MKSFTYLDLAPERFIRNPTYGMLSPNKPLSKAIQNKVPTTPKTVRKFKKNPLLSKHQKLDKVIMKKTGKLVQTTIEGKKTNAPPPKRGYTKKGKDKKPTKQGKLKVNKRPPKPTRKAPSPPKSGCRMVKFEACN